MSKKEVVNLEINREKFEEINRLIDEEANKRANAKIKEFVYKLVGVSSAVGVVMLMPSVVRETTKSEEEYLSSKAQQEQEYLNGERTTISDEEAFINGYVDEDDFIIKGDGWTGTYKGSK